MVDGPDANLGRRSTTCSIYGHYPSDTVYNFGDRRFEKLPSGVTRCGWCKETWYPWIGDPDGSYCRKLAIKRLWGALRSAA